MPSRWEADCQSLGRALQDLALKQRARASDGYDGSNTHITHGLTIRRGWGIGGSL